MKFFLVAFVLSVAIAKINCGSGDFHICTDVPDVGYPCSEGSNPSPSPTIRYFYNTTTLMCQELHFLGCGGNLNNFPSLQRCSIYCGSIGSARPSLTRSTTELVPEVDTTTEPITTTA